MLKLINFSCVLAVALAMASTFHVTPESEVDPEAAMENVITQGPWTGLNPWIDAANETENEEANDDEISASGGHRIVGGSLADMRYNPYQVSVHHKFSPNNFHCGGSIISKHLVLTAAHCAVLRPWKYFLRAGSNYFNGGHVYLVTQIFKHPRLRKVSKNIRDYDVAVMRIRGHFNYGTFVKPIPLAKRTPTPGVLAKVSGWGRTQTKGKSSHVLLTVKVPIISREACKRIYGWRFTRSMICAGYRRGGHGTCKGDSGGALVIGNEQVGVVSWGMRCGHWREPGVFADVAAARPWIQKIIERFG